MLLPPVYFVTCKAAIDGVSVPRIPLMLKVGLHAWSSGTLLCTQTVMVFLSHGNGELCAANACRYSGMTYIGYCANKAGVGKALYAVPGSAEANVKS